jgi:glycoprotein-N-acetylgalactosamine 3-beta-galactosyltransferase
MIRFQDVCFATGYVLSKEALRRFMEQALPDKQHCRGDGHGAEDLEMGM